VGRLQYFHGLKVATYVNTLILAGVLMILLVIFLAVLASFKQCLRLFRIVFFWIFFDMPVFSLDARCEN